MEIAAHSYMIPNLVTNVPDFNNNVVTDQSLKDDVNATVSHADNNTKDDHDSNRLNVWA